MKVSLMISDILSTSQACVQYESWTDAKERLWFCKHNMRSKNFKRSTGHTLHSRAVNIICVASKLWMKFGGKAEACLIALTFRMKISQQLCILYKKGLHLLKEYWGPR